MSREWQPGDVAMVNDHTGLDPEAIAVCVAPGVTGKARWRLMHRRGGEVWSSVSAARPLAVIDPEDREQVERLVGLATESPAEVWIDAFQRGLREYADPTPPKPDEPQGLGAVVEDAEGHCWTRARRNVSGWVSEHGLWREWDRVPAVRVLSDGVTA